MRDLLGDGLSRSGQRAGAGQKEPRRVAPSPGEATSGSNPPHFSNPSAATALPRVSVKARARGPGDTGQLFEPGAQRHKDGPWAKTPGGGPEAGGIPNSPGGQSTWLERHIGALNCLELDSFEILALASMRSLRSKYDLAISGIAEATGLSKRTVARCYDGKRVFGRTRTLVEQAARIGGFGEPPGSRRIVRE